MAFVSCFSTAGTDANNSPTIKLIPKSKICFMIVVALADSFKTLTTWGYLFLSTLLLLIAISASGIGIMGAVGGVTMGEGGTRFSLTGFYSPHKSFFGLAYSFSF